MTAPHASPRQPNLDDLMARYLAKQAESRAAGIATYDSEVHPYEVGPVQPLEPKLAWDEAAAALGEPQRSQAPPHWASLVANHESVVAIPLCAGNFPQLMRSLQTILAEPSLTKLRPQAERPVAAPDLADWTARQTQYPQILLALGTLRLAKHFDAADAFVLRHEAGVPAEWRAAWNNEKAALAWHRGRHEEARAIWDALAPSVPVLFNRGMAALFADDLAAARKHLAGIIAQVPDRSAWHHLARLYLALAQMR